MHISKRTFNSDISVTVNLSDKLADADKLLYVTLTYQYYANRKSYRLSNAIEFVYAEKEADNRPLIEQTIDPQNYFGDFDSRLTDAMCIVKDVLPDLEFRKKRHLFFH